jgi:hypothetical protein
MTCTSQQSSAKNAKANVTLSIVQLSITTPILITILLMFFLPAIAQTSKGTSAILLHNFSPTGVRIDGLPVTLFHKAVVWASPSEVIK